MWIPEARVLELKDTGRLTTGGEPMVEYRLANDAEVLLESLRSVRAADALTVLQAMVR